MSITLNTRLCRRLLALGLITGLTGPAFAQHPTPQMGAQSGILQASVSYKASPVPPQPAQAREAFINGTIVDDHHQPLSGVTVWVPDWQTSAVTRDDGTFTLPARAGKAAIASIQKPGYTPASATLDTDRLAGAPFKLSLRKGDSGTIVLDNQLRHLGDGLYTANSAGAAQFRGNTQGASFHRQFRLHAGALPRSLGIGSVIGLDTAMARQAGQSRFHKTSSPVTVLLNGRIIGYIGLNGDGHRLPIPPDALIANGLNTLEIQTGHRTDYTLDYDDIELMVVTLEL